MIDVIDYQVLRGAGDEAVHLDEFSFVFGDSVACCGCVSGIPLVFGEFVVIGGVYDGERAALDGDEPGGIW